MYSLTLSLTEPPLQSPVADSVAWIQAATMGGVATTVAVVAVAAIGLLILSGRLELRHGFTVVLGCFILFGASTIAATLTRLGGAETKPQLASESSLPPIASFPAASPAATYDPYAGASVPTAR